VLIALVLLVGSHRARSRSVAATPALRRDELELRERVHSDLDGCVRAPVHYGSRSRRSARGDGSGRGWGEPLLSSGSLLAASASVNGAWAFAVHNDNRGAELDAREAMWLTAASSIRNQSGASGAQRDIVVLKIGALSREAVAACHALDVHIYDVTSDYAELCAEIDCDYEHRGIGSMKNWRGMWIRLLAWKLTSYSRVVYLDNDVLMQRSADELFAFPELSAVRDLSFEYSSRYTGFENTFNSGLIVIAPSNATFRRLVRFVPAFRAAAIAKHMPPGPKQRWTMPLHILADQGVLNSYFSSCWNLLPGKYVVFSKMWNPRQRWEKHALVNFDRAGFTDVRILHYANDPAPRDVFNNYEPKDRRGPGSKYDGGCLKVGGGGACIAWRSAYRAMKQLARIYGGAASGSSAAPPLYT